MSWWDALNSPRPSQVLELLLFEHVIKTIVLLDWSGNDFVTQTVFSISCWSRDHLEAKGPELNHKIRTISFREKIPLTLAHLRGCFISLVRN